ncbi:MAG TPA: hypothetical protein VMD07_01520 [Candidatus Acidoferrales bacterium]|nr:hypothetical protein [Candidatus Acidoferrales bacterium]
MMRTIVLAAVVVLGLVAAGFPKSESITLPPSEIMFKPGPNLGLVQANCLVCHNADYVYFQPALTRAQWTAEVNKMRAAYKATIGVDDVPKIVDYLMSQNGKT